MQGRVEAAKAFTEKFMIKRSKDLTQSIVERNAVFQVQCVNKPFFFGFTISFNAPPVIGTADNCTWRNKENIAQLMTQFALHT